jgi:hypothetical protein
MVRRQVKTAGERQDFIKQHDYAFASLKVDKRNATTAR